jgi:hypothetical protein
MVEFWTNHFTIWAVQSTDPIVFMRVIRVVLLFISGLLLIFEPMNCGGRNRTFHYVLVALCWSGAWVSWGQAEARMTLIMRDPVHLLNSVPPASLFWPELFFTIAAVIVCGRLVYDSILWRRLHRLGCAADCGKKCIPTSMERRQDARSRHHQGDSPEGPQVGPDGA